MNLLDLTLVGFAVLAAVGGFRLGFLTRTISWIGLGLGLVAGTRLLPWALRSVEESSPATMLFVAGMVLLVACFVGQAIGVLIGSRIRFRLPSREWIAADHALGAVAGLVGIAASLWLLLPAMSHTTGVVAEQTRNSTVARFVDGIFPPAPDTLVALRRLVGDDQFPQVFDALTPAPDVGPPPADPGLLGDVIARVTPSTVKITGVACSSIQEGSGFVTLGPDVVVTNAHVVAGEGDTQVERDDGTLLDATVVVFDPARDLAVLRVPGLDRTPLAIGTPDVGASGGVFGRPGGAPLRVSPFVVGDQVRAQGTDIYDAQRSERDVLILGSNLRPGDSGAALIDGAGTVIGVAFAIAPDDPNVAYALDTTELEAVLAQDLTTPVDTGPCLR